MPSNYTSNYNLNQWAASDKVQRVDFNADNAKIDAALAGKASTSALTALENTVNSKLSGLQGAVSGQGAALSLRNCCFVTGTYQGNGEEGEASSITINFPRKPVYVRISSSRDLRSISAIRGQNTVIYWNPQVYNHLAFTWGAKSVSWHPVYNGSRLIADTHLNGNGTTYHYFAILELE